MTDFSAIVARVAEEYDRHKAEWIASLSPERLCLVKNNNGGLYRPPRRRGYSIETLHPGRVWRKMHPYVGVSLCSKKYSGRLWLYL